MGSLGTFSKKMRKASKAVLTNTDKLVVQIAEAILAAVVADTPVDTGQAKSNWFVSIGGPASDIRGPYAPGTKGSTALDNIIATVEMGNLKLAAYTSGAVLHITNNLDYIGELNDGSLSKQAPPNYVQLAILEALATVQASGFTILHNIEV